MKIINFINSIDYHEVIGSLNLNYYLVIEIDTSMLTSVEKIYEKIISKIPIGIPLAEKVNWDAFLDSAWEGITEQPFEKIVFFWHGSSRILTESLSDFTEIVDILKQLTVSLANNEPKRNLISFVIGDAPNYR